jgi:O-antigen ligase
VVRLCNKITYIFLWLTIFTMPFQKSFIVPGIGSLNKLFGLALVAMGIFTVLIKGEFKKLPLFYILLASFIFLSIMSYFWSEVPMDSVNKSILYFQLGFLSWAIYEFSCDKKKINGLFKAYVLGCGVIAIQSLYGYLFGGYQIVNGTRFFVEGYNPNQLGITWTLSLPLAMYLIIHGYKKYIIYVPFAAFSILLTGSRTALVLLAFVAVSILWSLFKYRVRFRKLITFVLIIIGFYVVSQIPQGQLDRLSTLKYELSSGTMNGRTTIWYSGVEAFKENPMFGAGSGAFAEAAENNVVNGEEMSAHNAYLSVLVENGMVGFILFGGMLIFMFVITLRTEKNNLYRWVSLTLLMTWLILSIVSHSEAQKYTWITFGLVVTSYYVNKKTVEVPKVVVEKNESKKRKVFKKRLVW